MSYPTRVRYGLRLLVRLALQDGERHLSMAEIAQDEGVSVKYLEQIVSLLKPMGILQAIRGARGGYSLVRDASEISMEQVFTSLGSIAAPVPCIDDPFVCDRANICTTRPFWIGLNTHMRSYLSRVTLADIVAASPRDGMEFIREYGLASACSDNL